MKYRIVKRAAMTKLRRRDGIHYLKGIVQLFCVAKAAQRAATVSIFLRNSVKISSLIIRVFLGIRHILTGDAELAEKVAELERQSNNHREEIEAIINALRGLTTEADCEPKRPGIGYETERKSMQQRD
jgi:hypothetical protein